MFCQQRLESPKVLEDLMVQAERRGRCTSYFRLSVLMISLTLCRICTWMRSESGVWNWRSLRRCQREHSCQAEWLQITSGCHGEIRVDLMEVLQLILCALCVCVGVCFFIAFNVTSVFHQLKIYSIPSQNSSVLTSDP